MERGFECGCFGLFARSHRSKDDEDIVDGSAMVGQPIIGLAFLRRRTRLALLAQMKRGFDLFRMNTEYVLVC